jgi:hypothetical protein
MPKKWDYESFLNMEGPGTLPGKDVAFHPSWKNDGLLEAEDGVIYHTRSVIIGDERIRVWLRRSKKATGYTYSDARVEYMNVGPCEADGGALRVGHGVVKVSVTRAAELLSRPAGEVKGLAAMLDHAGQTRDDVVRTAPPCDEESRETDNLS